MRVKKIFKMKARNLQKRKNNLFIYGVLFVCLLSPYYAGAHKVTFCGEQLPVNNDFVANKLMNVIRKQIPNVNLPSLRKRANIYFPIVEHYLRKYKLPLDLKYLAIVESGFVGNAKSRVGARGFWQFMPATAKQYGLNIEGPVDDRDDIHKSTNAACRLLIDNYNDLKRLCKITSWALACAAYNFGIGNMSKAVKVQGTNYYTMNLNPETSVYVYKIVAVKELFEYPELYMDKFGYNVFSENVKNKKASAFYGDDDDQVFKKAVLKKQSPASLEKDTTYYISAEIQPDKNFEEGDFVSITINEDFKTTKGLVFKNSEISPKGWVIDNRVMVDFGYGHDLLLFDLDLDKGIPLEKIKSKKKKAIPVLLKVTNYRF